MPLERLDKILVSQNAGSRKEVQQLIRGGRVTLDGRTVKKPETKADPEQSSITVDGAALLFKRRLYLMMNKPKGVVSASRDSAMKTVLDLLPGELCRRGLFPAGRLDRDTEGLLIITDDGDFAHRMLSPKQHVYKLYHAVVDGPVSQREIDAFSQGVEFSDGTKCLPAELSVLIPGEEPLVGVRICEGKFHQVKKMFLAVGRRVLSLKRVKIGLLSLDNSLLPGQARELTGEELEMIFERQQFE